MSAMAGSSYTYSHRSRSSTCLLDPPSWVFTGGSDPEIYRNLYAHGHIPPGVVLLKKRAHVARHGHRFEGTSRLRGGSE